MVYDNFQDETMEVDETTISPPDPSMTEELIIADYNVPSDVLRKIQLLKRCHM